MHTIRLEKLKFLIAVKEHGSMLAASRALGTVQSNVSRIIGELEFDVQTKLLLRHANGTSLTSAGDDLYQTAIRIRHEIEKFSSRQKGRELFKGHYTIGAYDSIARYFFSSFLRYMSEVNPETTIDIKANRSEEIIKLVKSGDILLGLVVREKSDSKAPGFMEVYEDHFELYQKTGYNSHLFSQRVIFFKHWATPARLSYLKKILQFKYVIETENIETIKGLVEQGLGVGILPTRVAQQGRASGIISLVTGKTLSKECRSPHVIGIQTNPDFLRSEDHAAFTLELTDFIKQWAES